MLLLGNVQEFSPLIVAYYERSDSLRLKSFVVSMVFGVAVDRLVQHFRVVISFPAGEVGLVQLSLELIAR